MVEKVDVQEFFKRTMGGRPCQLDLSIYIGCTYECGCGKTHTFSPSSTEVARELPMLKLVLQQNDCKYITAIKIKGFFKYKFETLFSAVNAIGE